LTRPTRGDGKKPALVTLLAKAANNETKETEHLRQTPHHRCNCKLPAYLKKPQVANWIKFNHQIHGWAEEEATIPFEFFDDRLKT
jgi:hypothetical protein